MGCDIHGVVEQLDEDKGWVGLHSFPWTCSEHRSPLMDRDYEFFADLAGVRGNGPAPLGFPKDASPLAHLRAEDWGEDGHSHSWIRAEELLPLFVKYKISQKRRALLLKEQMLKRRARPFEYALRESLCIDDEDVPLSDIRLVFWFDN